ncbi:3784_t:CDS:1, partial [Cetraspora pellucida]
MSNKKKKERLYIPIETNPFTLAAQVTKSTVKTNNNNELLSSSESPNESETNSNDEIQIRSANIKHPRLNKKNLKWNPDWLKFYPWIRAEPSINPSKLYCKWCEKAKFSNIFTEGTDWFKEQYLIRHLKSKDHQKAQEIETHTQLTIHESIRKPLSTEKLKVIQNMRNMYWLVENNIATLNIQG